jgi:NDP-sugar pyrophosphorylase family protein
METEIRAMILAAGFGERMKKAGEQTPKPLVKVCGRPLIHYPLALIAGAGFREVVINLHYRAEEIKKEIGKSALDSKSLL